METFIIGGFSLITAKMPNSYDFYRSHQCHTPTPGEPRPAKSLPEEPRTSHSPLRESRRTP
ncbi:MAG: hypothetical protein LIP12_14140 [Clostridiales bacterium]|nr:hypothetical protein [Clostridiales bacterium]